MESFATSEVWLAIIVHVDKQRPEAVISGRIADAKLLADIGKRSVSVVVKEMVVFALDAAGAAHHRRHRGIGRSAVATPAAPRFGGLFEVNTR